MNNKKPTKRPVKPGKSENPDPPKAQAPFRLSANVVKFLSEVAELGGVGTGQVAEDCLWAQLPIERQKYLDRLNLIAEVPLFKGGHRPPGK